MATTTRRTFRAALARTRLGQDEQSYEVEITPSLADRLVEFHLPSLAMKSRETSETAERLAEKLREVASIGRPARVALTDDEAEQLLAAVVAHMPVASRRSVRVCRRIERRLRGQLELTEASAQRDEAAERVRDLAIQLIAEESENLSLIARQANVSRGTLYAWLKLSRRS